VDDTGLSIERAMPDLRAALGAGPAAVLVAPPGSGKTAMVPLRRLAEQWLGDGKIVVPEPPRIATRAAARRMAHLLGEPVGKTAGYVTRGDVRVGPRRPKDPGTPSSMCWEKRPTRAESAMNR